MSWASPSPTKATCHPIHSSYCCLWVFSRLFRKLGITHLSPKKSSAQYLVYSRCLRVVELIQTPLPIEVSSPENSPNEWVQAIGILFGLTPIPLVSLTVRCVSTFRLLCFPFISARYKSLNCFIHNVSRNTDAT